MLAHLQPKGDGVYLDIGCGTGNYTREFQEQGYRFIGIDPSQRMLNEAQLEKNRNYDSTSARNTARSGAARVLGHPAPRHSLRPR
ncbi:MAG: class I SAM-dependent methyltransferase [bacterium]|nr:class I SAM-dependent methyltransferase [bacterium]